MYAIDKDSILGKRTSSGYKNRQRGNVLAKRSRSFRPIGRPVAMVCSAIPAHVILHYKEINSCIIISILTFGNPVIPRNPFPYPSLNHHNSTSTLTSLLHPACSPISSHAASTSTSSTGACSEILTVCIGTTFSEIMTKTSFSTDFSCRVDT